jgi:hypothetical protein
MNVATFIFSWFLFCSDELQNYIVFKSCWNANLLFIPISKSQREDFFHKMNLTFFQLEYNGNRWLMKFLSRSSFIIITCLKFLQLNLFNFIPVQTSCLSEALDQFLLCVFWWSTFNTFSDFFSLNKGNPSMPIRLNFLLFAFIHELQFYLAFLHQSNPSSIF